jgi:hypothetical protein
MFSGLSIIPSTNTTDIQDPLAAQALVSAHPSSSTTKDADAGPADSSSRSNETKDIQRAKDLIEMHYAVQVAHANGTLERELSQARDAVRQLNFN